MVAAPLEVPIFHAGGGGAEKPVPMGTCPIGVGAGAGGGGGVCNPGGGCEGWNPGGGKDGGFPVAGGAEAVAVAPCIIAARLIGVPGTLCGGDVSVWVVWHVRPIWGH